MVAGEIRTPNRLTSRYRAAMRVLRVRGFTPLLVGQAVNETGNWIAVIAIWGFASFQFDVGAGDLALLFVVLSVPSALLGPLMGVPIDRLGPRRTLLIANLIGVVDALALTRADSYEMIILLALPLGLIEALAAASLDAIPPRLVPDDQLVTANALLGRAGPRHRRGPDRRSSGQRAVGPRGSVLRRRRDVPRGCGGRAPAPGSCRAARSRRTRDIDMARAARRVHPGAPHRRSAMDAGRGELRLSVVGGVRRARTALRARRARWLRADVRAPPDGVRRRTGVGRSLAGGCRRLSAKPVRATSRLRWWCPA